jgi:hypothetical protein
LQSGFANVSANTNDGFLNSYAMTGTLEARSSVVPNKGDIVIGNINTTTANFRLNGYLSELIIYTNNQSANRTAIEANINQYYGIY